MGAESQKLDQTQLAMCRTAWRGHGRTGASGPCPPADGHREQPPTQREPGGGQGTGTVLVGTAHQLCTTLGTKR